MASKLDYCLTKTGGARHVARPGGHLTYCGRDVGYRITAAGPSFAELLVHDMCDRLGRRAADRIEASTTHAEETDRVV